MNRERASERRSREGPLVRLTSLTQIGELARRLAPAGLLSLCSESVFILLSSFNIPTLKSRSVLSDPFISAGGSWTLRKFSSLFLSGVDSVEESESLLLMPPGSHSLLSQHHTGLNNSQ